MEWCREYRRDGVAALVDKRVGGNRARLSSSEIEQLGEQLRMYTPAELFGSLAATADGQFWTVEDLQRAVERWYDVIYRSRSSYLRLFDLCGFSYQRPEKRYRSRSEPKIAEFEIQLEKN